MACQSSAGPRLGDVNPGFLIVIRVSWFPCRFTQRRPPVLANSAIPNTPFYIHIFGSAYSNAGSLQVYVSQLAVANWVHFTALVSRISSQHIPPCQSYSRLDPPASFSPYFLEWLWKYQLGMVQLFTTAIPLKTIHLYGSWPPLASPMYRFWLAWMVSTYILFYIRAIIFLLPRWHGLLVQNHDPPHVHGDATHLDGEALMVLESWDLQTPIHIYIQLVLVGNQF